MISVKRIYALFVGRNLEFFRDRSSFIWQFLFPVIIIVMFAFAFGKQGATTFKAGIVNLEKAKEMQLSILDNQFINYIDISNLQDGIKKVESHSLDILLDPVSHKFWINTESKNGALAQTLIFNISHADTYTIIGTDFTKQTLTGKPLRYIDWLFPGLLSMNMMFSALFGIGFVIVRYRKNEVLKRLKATPTKSIEFLIAQLSSRMLIIIFNLVVIFIGLNFFFKFRMLGSYFDLLLILLLGSISLISIGLIIAAQIKNEEVANGLLNLISWPLMLLSEIWYSLDNANVIVQKVSNALPLIQITKLARAVMLDGKSIFEMPYQLSYLLIFSAVCLTIGASTFKWE